MRIAERGYVDAHQLELRGRVRFRETRRAAGELRRDDLGHRVTRRHDAVHAALDRGTLTDRVNRRIACPAGGIHQDATAWPHVQAARTREVVTRPDTGGEHDQIDVQLGAVAQFRQQPFAVGLDRVGGRSRVDGHVQRGDHPAQHRTAALVHLQRHQARRHLDDMRGKTHVPQRLRGLEPEQAATDDDGGAPPHTPALGGRADGVEVLNGPINEATGQVVPRHRRHERPRAGRQHQGVIRLREPGCGGDRLGGAVNLRHNVAKTEFDVRIVRVVGARQGERRGIPAVHIGRESHPVVRRARLLGQDDDPPGTVGIFGAHRLHQPMRDHTVSGDDQGGHQTSAPASASLRSLGCSAGLRR